MTSIYILLAGIILVTTLFALPAGTRDGRHHRR